MSAMFRRTLSLVAAAVLTLAACSSSPTDVTETSSRSNEPADADDVAGDDSGNDAEPVEDGGTDSGGDDTNDDEAPLVEFEPAPIEWDEFNEAVDVAAIEVPVDYQNPNGPRFELFVARYHALDQDNKIGSLLVNPGGPGFGGTDLAFFAAQIFDRPLRVISGPPVFILKGKIIASGS